MPEHLPLVQCSHQEHLVASVKEGLGREQQQSAVFNVILLSTTSQPAPEGFFLLRMDPSPALLVTQSSLLGVGLQDEAAEVFQEQLLVNPPLMIFHLTNPQSTNLIGKLKLFDAMITMFQSLASISPFLRLLSLVYLKKILPHQSQTKTKAW